MDNRDFSNGGKGKNFEIALVTRKINQCGLKRDQPKSELLYLGEYVF